MNNLEPLAESIYCELYVPGNIWFNGGRMPPEYLNHCVFTGSLWDAWHWDNGTDSMLSAYQHDLDWNKMTIKINGQFYKDFAEINANWDDEANSQYRNR